MKVTATLQHGQSEPVEVPWARSNDDTEIILAVVQLLQHRKDQSPWNPETLDIHIHIKDRA